MQIQKLNRRVLYEVEQVSQKLEQKDKYSGKIF